MRILVTGAAGFVGCTLVQRLKDIPGVSICAVVRSGKIESSPKIEILNQNLLPDTQWRDALRGADTVIHLAARVHMMRDRSADPMAAFRLINTEGTLNLARQAADTKVRRFIFLSSLKVNGEETVPGEPFSSGDSPNPSDAYGISKSEAERGLKQIASSSGMEVVIIRPPLVYGPGVKANFLSMMRWIKRGIPLPLGAINNRRSFVALDNLVDLILRCIDHPAAANRTFLVSDDEDMSTTELLRRLAKALDAPERLIPVPARWLALAARVCGKGTIAQRLLGSLQVDITETRRLLNWAPPINVDEGLRRTARGIV